MEVFQLQTNSWFLPRELFLPDPLSDNIPPTLCHILTGHLALALSHRVSVKEYEQNLMGYLWRFKAGDGVLRVYNVTLRQVMREEAELEVLCEKMCFRPEEIINQLSVQEQLYLIGAVVRTAQALSAKFGYFGMELPMVGLEKNGEVRVWINSNAAQNRREVELQTEEQQFSQLMRLFASLKIQNRLVNAYLQNIFDLDIGFKHFQDYHDKFMRLHHLKIKQSIPIVKLALGRLKQKQVQSCPTSSLKLTTEFFDMGTTLKEHSLNIKSPDLSKSYEFAKRFPIAPRLRACKENRRSSEKNTKASQKSSSCKVNLGSSQERLPLIPGKILASRAKLQESLFVQDKLRPQSHMFGELQLLGKMGRVCESTTAEQLILEQFKNIYQ